ncbi:MAG: hypothetical protein AAFP26_10835, partial [Planctomycetota bacterium]
MPVGFRATCLTELGSAAGAEASRSLINSCIQAASLGAVGSLLVNPVTAGIVGVGLIAGGVYLDARRAKKSKAELDTSLTELLHAIHTQGKKLDAYIDRIEHAEGGPNAVARELAAVVHADGAATRAHIDEWMRDVGIYLSKMAIDAETAARESTRGAVNTDQIKDELKLLATKDDIAALMRQLQSRGNQDGPKPVDPSRERDLAGALEEIIRLAAEGDSSAKQALSANDGREAAQAMFAEARRVRHAKERAIKVVTERETELNRETSAIALEAGELEIAEAAAIRVLELKPNDPDAINRRGLIAAEQGRIADANELFDRLVKAEFPTLWRSTAYYNWGLNLQERVPHNGGAKRQALLRSACEKYSRALSLHPRKPN